MEVRKMRFMTNDGDNNDKPIKKTITGAEFKNTIENSPNLRKFGSEILQSIEEEFKQMEEEEHDFANPKIKSPKDFNICFKQALVFLFLLSIAIPAEEKMKFERHKKPLDLGVCKTNKFADCLAVKYIQHYYPNTKNGDWYHNTSVSHYFDYKVNYQNEREKGEIQFSFQSYSDGLEWKYWEDSVIIRIKDPMKLIEKKETLDKIKEKLESKFDKNYEIEKITKIINRELMQSQPNPKEYYSIEEKIKYKIRVNGQNLSFNGGGNKID